MYFDQAVVKISLHYKPWTREKYKDLSEIKLVFCIQHFVVEKVIPFFFLTLFFRHNKIHTFLHSRICTRTCVYDIVCFNQHWAVRSFTSRGQRHITDIDKSE